MEQPDNLNIQLHPYQLSIISEMENYETTRCRRTPNPHETMHSNVGINADKIGYGKTLEMIGLICRDRMKWELGQPFLHIKSHEYSQGYIRSDTITEYKRLKTTLIVVAPGLVGQWEHELAYSTLRVKTITPRYLIQGILENEFDVVLVPATLANGMIDYANGNKLAWKRFIMDEPGQLLIPHMIAPKAVGMIWFVTATPNDIQMRYLTRIRPNFITDLFFAKRFHNRWEDGTTIEETYAPLIFRNEDAYVQESYQMPATLFEHHQCYQPIATIVQVIDIERKIKLAVEAGDMDAALRMVGGRRTDNFIHVLQKQRRNDIQDIDLHLSSIQENPLYQELIPQLQTKRARIAKELQTLEERYQHMLEGDCPICRTTFEQPMMEPYCQNIFCGSCLLTWMNTQKTCPLCRHAITFSELHKIRDTADSSPPASVAETSKRDRKLTKPELIASLVQEKPNGKFLIFSAFDNTFEPVYAYLEEAVIPYTRLRGNVEMRTRKLEEFRTSHTLNVIILNTSEHAAGLNLPETTDIIITHAIPETTLTQIIGRGLRLGRTEPLTVHFLE